MLNRIIESIKSFFQKETLDVAVSRLRLRKGDVVVVEVCPDMSPATYKMLSQQVAGFSIRSKHKNMVLVIQKDSLHRLPAKAMKRLGWIKQDSVV